MATQSIDILLTKNVFKLGLMGDLVRVKPGYARNFLFPSGSAVPAGQAAKRQIEILRERATAYQAQLKSEAEGLKTRIQGTRIEIKANVSSDRRLFGSVGIRDIVQALTDKGISVTNNQVALHDNIRQLGDFDIRLQLFEGVECDIKLTVANANPNAALDDLLAEKADAEAAADDAAAD